MSEFVPQVPQSSRVSHGLLAGRPIPFEVEDQVPKLKIVSGLYQVQFRLERQFEVIPVALDEVGAAFFDQRKQHGCLGSP